MAISRAKEERMWELADKLARSGHSAMTIRAWASVSNAQRSRHVVRKMLLKLSL